MPKKTNNDKKTEQIAMTLDERIAISDKWGHEKMTDIFSDFIVARMPHADVCKKYSITAIELDDILRVCFYSLDDAGRRAADAVEEQKAFFDVVVSRCGAGTKARISKAMKRVAKEFDEMSKKQP